MTTVAAKTLNRSAHTLGDLKKYAQRSTAGATTYLKQVEADLKATGQADAAKAVHALLADKTGTLNARITEHREALLGVFPADAAGWEDLQQSQRAQTLGWNTATTAGEARPQYLTGKLTTNAAGEAVIAASGGRTYPLAASMRQTGGVGLPVGWMVGMVGDGPISLQGTVSEDQQTFNVEGFALNTDGKFDTFTFGRVSEYAGNVTVLSPRGEVEIADARLAKKLKAMPRLGVILPGAPEEKKDGSLVYRGNPSALFGLARFRETFTTGTGKTRTAPADMAYSIFANKPVSMPAAQADRVSHTGRIWLRGSIAMKGDEAVAFHADYVSKQTDLGGARMAYSGGDADLVQAAVMGNEAV